MANNVNIENEIMDVLAMASLTTDLKFTGLNNTNELIETLKELFSFSNIKINNGGYCSLFDVKGSTISSY